MLLQLTVMILFALKQNVIKYRVICFLLFPNNVTFNFDLMRNILNCKTASSFNVYVTH